MHPPSGQARPPGRPREFDMERVLDLAIQVFSRNGYGATSIRDLSEAMGLSQGSIYKAFGDKRAVLVAAFERTVARRAEALGRHLEAAATGRDRVRLMLDDYAAASVGTLGRQGCLVVATLVEMSSSDRELHRRIVGLFRSYEDAFARAIRQGHADGSIPARIDPGRAARLLLCVVQGMRVVGKAERTRAQMSAMAEDALRLLD